jgi:hypothetical protein
LHLESWSGDIRALEVCNMKLKSVRSTPLASLGGANTAKANAPYVL